MCGWLATVASAERDVTDTGQLAIGTRSEPCLATFEVFSPSRSSSTFSAHGPWTGAQCFASHSGSDGFSDPIVVLSPCPVRTTVFPGSVRRRSRIDATIVA